MAVPKGSRCQSCGQRIGARRRAQHSVKVGIDIDLPSRVLRDQFIGGLPLVQDAGNLKDALDEFTNFDDPEKLSEWADDFEAWCWYGRCDNQGERSAIFLNKLDLPVSPASPSTPREKSAADFTMFSLFDFAFRHFRQLRAQATKFARKTSWKAWFRWNPYKARARPGIAGTDIDFKREPVSRMFLRTAPIYLAMIAPISELALTYTSSLPLAEATNRVIIYFGLTTVIFMVWSMLRSLSRGYYLELPTQK